MMRQSAKSVVFVAAMFVVGMAGASTTPDAQSAQDKKEVEALVRTLYSKRIREVESPRGQGEFRKSCEYLRSVFEAALLKGDSLACDGPTRFPTVDPYEISDFDDANKLPASRIVGSSVNDGVAVVKVQAPIIKNRTPGRVVYYLKKTDGRWKVANLLTYDQWPLDTTQEGGCRYVSGHYSFALPPKTEADLEDLPPLCKALELDNMRRSGSSGAQQKAK